MAGDWIKIEIATSQKIEVFQLAEILDLDVDTVLGKLMRLWCWADVNTINGHAKSVTKKLLDRVVACDGFATALLDERVGWLEEDENGNLRLPNFDRHNGKGAKKRATDAERQANKRAKDVKQNVPDMSRKERDNNVTREEKRREDLKDITPHNPPRGREPKKSYPYPEQLNAEAWEEWKAYRRENRFKAYAPTERSEGAAITELINLSGGDRQRQMMIVKQSMAKGWKGLFELKDGSGRRDVNVMSQPDNQIPPGFRGGPPIG
ncbi:DNA replication domain protein [Raoultella ornithinolytica]|uniref:DNA replication domain protein n=1 Tax=Raoultella ornithinolytica TaxID=54291 RepID=UPI000B4D9B5D|nr:DNA replication domain protein [Raoultella ornithinolytica]OWP44713.1 DNA replication domain protein [Raoultella ornithinolytica]